MRSTIFKKIRLAMKVTINAKKVFKNIPASGKKIKASNRPNCAASKDPAVVGDTNLFRVRCCIIKPLTLKPIPAETKEIVLGKRLTDKIKSVSVPPLNISVRERFATPIKSERMLVKSKVKTKTNLLKNCAVKNVPLSGRQCW